MQELQLADLLSTYQRALTRLNMPTTTPPPPSLPQPYITPPPLHPLCRLNIGKVQVTLANSYGWSISRQSSATSVAVTADGYSRKQLGES